MKNPPPTPPPKKYAPPQERYEPEEPIKGRPLKADKRGRPRKWRDDPRYRKFY
jgi:hypothetical protein